MRDQAGDTRTERVTYSLLNLLCGVFLVLLAWYASRLAPGWRMALAGAGYVWTILSVPPLWGEFAEWDASVVENVTVGLLFIGVSLPLIAFALFYICSWLFDIPKDTAAIIMLLAIIAVGLWNGKGSRA